MAKLRIKRVILRADLQLGLTRLEARLARERYLIQLAYRALGLAFRKAHLGAGWIAHFKAKADRLFSAALDTWRRDA